MRHYSRDIATWHKRSVGEYLIADSIEAVSSLAVAASEDMADVREASNTECVIIGK